MERQLEHSHRPREIAKRLQRGHKASYLRDWVYGGIDGTVTTFAIMAGVVGANLSPGVLRAMEERHVKLAPEGEREEVRQIFQAKGFKGKALDTAVEVITARRDRWIDTMMAEEHGVPQVTRLPLRAASMTFIAFVLCGSVPLLPYAAMLEEPVLPATIMTAFTFFGIGSLRGIWSPTPWWRAGLGTLAIGMLAAGAAYAVGTLLQGLV